MKTYRWSFVTIKQMLKYPYIYLGLILAFSLFTYTKWTTVTTREILIDSDKIDKVIFNDSIDQKSYQIVADGIIDIIIPFSMVDTNNIIKNYYHYYIPDTILEINNIASFSLDTTYNEYLDSLYNYYQERTPDSTKSFINNSKLPIFHSKIELSYDNWFIFRKMRNDRLIKTDYEPYLFFPYAEEIKKDDNHITYLIESYHSIGRFYYSENIGALSKPYWFNKNDLSQFYIKLHIESHSLRSIFLNIDFRGANDYKFIKCQPDSTNGTQLLYHLVSDTTNHSINEDIMIHVHSKELASIQNERVFLLSTLISAIIALALSSIVIKINNNNFKKKCEQKKSDQNENKQNESEKKESKQNESEKKESKQKKSEQNESEQKKSKKKKTKKKK